MVYYIYKTTNKLNGRFYIGKRKARSLTDYYMGSGTLLKRALVKYGKSNFDKEILFVVSNEQEMNEKEAEIVTEAFCSDPNTYNVIPGGANGTLGYHHTTETKAKIGNANRNRPCTEQHKKQISDALKGKPSPHRGRTLSFETRKKMSEAAQGRIVSNETRQKISAGLKASERYRGK